MSDYTINMDEINDLSYEDLEKQMNSEADKAASGVVGLINKNGDPVSLFEFKHDSIENDLTITPTLDGQHLLMNAFGQPALNGKSMLVDLDMVDPQVLGFVFGQSDTGNNFKGSFGDFIERAQSNTGTLKIMGNQEELIAYSKKSVTLGNKDVVNSRSGHFGSAIESSNGTSKRFVANTYDTGKLNGLNSVTVEGVRSNLSPEAAREESDKLAFEHAAHQALLSQGLQHVQSEFHINDRTGLGFKLTHSDNLIFNASKSSEGFTHRNSQWEKNSVEMSFSELKGLKTGVNENQTSKQSIQQVFHYIEKSSEKTKESFVTQLMLRKLIGAEPLTGNDIKFEGNVDGGKLKLKLLPLSGLSPSLMSNPGHLDLREQGLEDKSLSEITLANILDQDVALRNIYNVEPNLVKNSFVNAIKARKDMDNYIRLDMVSAGLVSSASSNAFSDYLARPLTGGGEYYLKSESIGQDNNANAMERLLERSLSKELDDSILTM